MGESLFKNKYRIPPARLLGWDYGGNGIYFITICVKNHRCVFGWVKNGRMQLNELGGIANSEWLKIFGMRNNISPDAFVIMPNHIHGIVIIGEDKNILEMHQGAPIANPETHQGASVQENIMARDSVETHLGVSRNKTEKHQDVSISQETHQGASVRNRFGPMSSGGLASIVNQYKGAVKRWCNKNGHSDFQWQSRYHDHVIRNEFSLSKIRDYIANNPANWSEDKFFVK